MNIKISIVVVLFLIGLQSIKSQELINWTILGDVKFEQVYLEDLGFNTDQATFGKLVKPLDGMEVSISGFVIPLDAFGTSYALSRNPNSSCFFCGGAGPETVIQLKLKPSAFKRYKMDDVLSFKGVLQLNETNENEFTYVLDKAEPSS